MIYHSWTTWRNLREDNATPRITCTYKWNYKGANNSNKPVLNKTESPIKSVRNFRITQYDNIMPEHIATIHPFSNRPS